LAPFMLDGFLFPWRYNVAQCHSQHWGACVWLLFG